MAPAPSRGIRTEAFAKVEVHTAAALRDWLAKNHARTDSVWLVTWKKSVPEKYVSVDAVLDELIAWGWVDGVRRKLDERRTMQLISPRKQQAWARSYKERAARLEREGRMAEPGRLAIARSKAEGKWNDSDAIDALTVPSDLSRALKEERAADTFFRSAAPSYRRNVLRWLAAARRPETRDQRILRIVERSSGAKKVPHL